jgi:FdhE protein
MPRTATGLRNDPATRLAGLARQHPEWQTWFALLDVAWHAVQDPRWEWPLEATELTASPREAAPLLHGRTLWVNGARARRLLKALASAAELEGRHSLGSYQPSESEALELIGASICQQHDVIQTLANEHQIHPGALSSLAHLATLPVLQRCGRQLQPHVPRYWPAGYCPICGTWPTLAERRGLDRSRRLRCGRCAADWEVQWLYCVYCGERDHTRLGSLAVDEKGDQVKVETCASCRGYLKSVATLQGSPPLELLIQDLETVELDLVALEREYRRPSASGFPVSVLFASHAPRGSL